LARWLPVEVFGIYALANSIVKLSVCIANFGMGAAFIHRAPETKDEDLAAAVHFTLSAIFTLVWAILLIGSAYFFADDQLRTAIWVITATAVGVQLTSTASLILMRRVTQRRQAVIQALIVLISTPVMLGLAWQGIALWALLTLDLVTVVLNITLLYIWKPVWQPRLGWDRRVVRYFLQFGSRNFLNSILRQALDRVDDIWVGFYLGNTATGFYSKAYSLATYPSKVLAAPINWSIGGALAELKGDRGRLSIVFNTTSALLIRSGFFLGGLLASIAPELILLLFGDKWLPMSSTFRLMLVFTLFDPLKIAFANVVGLSGGKPEHVVQARAVQLVCMVSGLFLLGSSWGTVGVAIAVDLMMIVGIGILLWRAQSYVDFSLIRLFAVPGIALCAGLILSGATPALFSGSDWQVIIAKSMTFSITYSVFLMILEYRWFLGKLSFLARRLRHTNLISYANRFFPGIGGDSFSEIFRDS